MKISFRKLIGGNNLLFVAVFFLIAVSAVSVYSSSSVLGYTKQGGEIGYYLFKHLFMLGLAVLAIVGASKLSPKVYSATAEIMLFLGVIGLFPPDESKPDSR